MGPSKRGVSTVGIIGPGRAGLGLALALKRAGVKVAGVHGRREKPVPAGVELTAGGAPPWLGAVGVVLLAVRDEALHPAVAELVRGGGLVPGQVVLHLSGAETSDALLPLTDLGAHVGSMHPLMTVSPDPTRAAKHFKGATFALEGEFTAVRAADGLVRRLGGVPVFVAPELKPLYHAGAVFASNYVVTLLAVAEELLVRAGIESDAARAALVTLARATLENVAALGSRGALTGPIARGDVATVRKHLDQLGGERKKLYLALAEATLGLARDVGLNEEAARRLLEVLGRAATVGQAGPAT